MLPTMGDVIRAIFFEKNMKKIGNEASIKLVSQQIHELWCRSNIPVVEKRTICQKISAYFSKYDRLCRCNKKRDKKFKNKMVSFRVSFRFTFTSININYTASHTFSTRRMQLNSSILHTANALNQPLALVLLKSEFQLTKSNFCWIKENGEKCCCSLRQFLLLKSLQTAQIQR